jgi:pimeloyl-ACP methyl ester carboxylesterase
MTTGSVVSKDGTRIGYLRVGQGPAVVLLHGSSESARSHTQLALALADTFTVYLPDRRGLDLAPPVFKLIGRRIAGTAGTIGAEIRSFFTGP